MKKLLLLFLLLAQSLGAQEWLTDFGQAKQQAQQEDKYILLNFSGSDWCIPCIQMKEQIFAVDAFQQFAAEKLVLLNADFPRRGKNKLSKAQQASNEALAGRYNPEGQFPMTLLLDAKGKKLSSWKGLPQLSPEAFVEAISDHLFSPTPPLQSYTRSLSLMGSRFDFTVVSPNEEWAYERMDSAIAETRRIETLISTWREDSEASAINRQAGVAPVQVSRELFDLIKRANRVSGLTDGAFDLTFGGLDEKIWRFDGSLLALPDSITAAQAVRLINYHNILLDEQAKTVFLKEKGMRLGFGAIGKGYAAERAKALLQQLGVQSGIVNAGGDLTAWGLQPNGQPWTIGIADPQQQLKAFSWLEIQDQAVVTSGNYEKYVIIEGQKYSHIVDPRTGYPVSGLQSVTVICANAELADALATAVYVMGKDEGLALINQLNLIECIIVDEGGQVFTSAGIEVKG